MARHSLEEHTGELELRLEGATLGEMFGEAARALAEIMGGPAARGDGGQAGDGGPFQEVSLQAPDRDALLVDWVNELIFLAERDKKVFGEVRIDRISDQALRASVRGEAIEDVKLHVKAATFHGLDIREGREGFTANLVLDV